MTAMAMESKVNGASYSPQRSHTSARHMTAEDDSDDDDDLVFPTVPALKQSKSMQQQVDECIQQLVKINEQGKFRSQTGGVENVWVKREVPWLQNYILGGSNTMRVSLFMSQWVSGFSQIIREVKNTQIRNCMLDYMSDLMEESHDFGWQAAKASHAALLCKMEENKTDWHETNKIDRIRRVHAQRSGATFSQSSNLKKGASRSPTPCKYFQKNFCHQKADHEANGIKYLHVCQNCFSQGKSLKHPANECKTRAKKRVRHCSSAV